MLEMKMVLRIVKRTILDIILKNKVPTNLYLGISWVVHLFHLFFPHYLSACAEGGGIEGDGTKVDSVCMCPSCPLICCSRLKERGMFSCCPPVHSC